jgi:hypothetical protein
VLSVIREHYGGSDVVDELERTVYGKFGATGLFVRAAMTDLNLDLGLISPAGPSSQEASNFDGHHGRKSLQVEGAT